MGMIKPYRDEAVQQIKEIGQTLIDRADSFIGKDMDMITDVQLNIRLGMHDDALHYPELKIIVSTSSQETLDRWRE